MAVVYHDERVIFFGEAANALQVGDDAVHGEDAVRGNQPDARVFCLAQTALQILHIVVLVAITLCLAQAHAVNDAGMIQRVADDCILFVQQRLEQASVGVEAGGIQNRILHAEEG